MYTLTCICFRRVFVYWEVVCVFHTQIGRVHTLHRCQVFQVSARWLGTERDSLCGVGRFRTSLWSTSPLDTPHTQSPRPYCRSHSSATTHTHTDICWVSMFPKDTGCFLQCFFLHKHVMCINLISRLFMHIWLMWCCSGWGGEAPSTHTHTHTLMYLRGTCVTNQIS